MRRRLIGTLALSTALVVPTASVSALPADSAPRAAVVGAQTSGDSLFPAQGNGGYDVSSYDLDLRWVNTGSITATATIAASTTGAPLSQFSLDLQGLTVTGVTVDGTAATFTRIASAPAYKLVVTPATPVDGAFTTVVTYSGTPVQHTDPDGSKEGWTATGGGAVALNEPVGAMTWMPVNNTTTDKATYTTRLTVPYNFLSVANRSAVSNGVLTSTSTGSSTRTFTWTQTRPQAPYLALVAIGNYTSASSDVALTSGSVPEWSYANSTIAGSSGFSTRRGQFSAVLRAIEARYGTYPGTATGLVVDTTSLGYALETQDRPYFEGSIDQETLVHELAHQWYGDAVSPADWSDVWLNEGPATFIATQVLADLAGGEDTETTYFDLWSSTPAGSSLWQTPVAGFTDPADLFGWQVYNRGAMALEALREAIGDSAFRTLLRTWVTQRSGGVGSTAQFTALAETVSGLDLDAFFQDWLFDTDKPAWPSRWSASLTSTPASGTQVGSDDHVTYTLGVANTGKVAISGRTVDVDVADLVAGASLDALPAGVTRSGGTLRWAVPTTAAGATSSVTVGATLDHLASADPIVVTASVSGLGASCGACSSTLPVDVRFITPAPTPTVRGTYRVEKTLTASVGTWDANASLRYQWLRDGNAIPRATKRTYTLQPADAGTLVSFATVGTREGYTTAVRTSEPGKVAPGVQHRRPRPVIEGAARVGRRVRAEAGEHDPGARVTYQWYADGKPITGATHASLKLTGRLRGAELTVRTTSRLSGYRTVATRSAAVTVRG